MKRETLIPSSSQWSRLTAPTVEQAEINLEEFSLKWSGEYPSISSSWKNNWARIIPLFGYPPEIRKVIYTTNAIVR